jgi:hypothetical protein
VDGEPGFEQVLVELDEVVDALGPADPRRTFAATYRRTTQAVADEVTAGRFLDPEWVERWDVAFARLYLAPIRADLAGDPVAGPWAVTFRYAREKPDAPVLFHLLLGLNAHINYDLPQALLAVLSDDELADPAVRARRNADHEHVDEVLVARVSAEDDELVAMAGPGGLSLSDRFLQPANRAASRRFLREARRKVWANTAVLWSARMQGPQAYERTLAELEALSAAKIDDLMRPGPVLIRLGVTGFGVLLPRAEEAGRRRRRLRSARLTSTSLPGPTVKTAD